MMLLKILLVLLQFFKGISSQGFSVSAVVDHSAILPCNVSHCMEFHWIKNHPIRTPVAKCLKERCIIQEGFQGRFKLADDINNGNYSLLINSVKFNYRGIYQCKCDGITNDVTLQVDVYINVTAEESANIALKCYADTQTDVDDVTWIHNDKKVLYYLKDGHTNLGEGYEGRVSLTRDGFRYGDLSLTLTEVQKTDAGLYRCFVHDETTKGDPHAYMLHVNDKMGKPKNSEVIYLLLGAIIIIIIVLFAIIVIFSVLLYKRKTSPSPTDVNHPLTSDTFSQPSKRINGF
ncbi:polymeric immunoglobulin receptor-like [Paramisgurnus dabryanus]|uniref:polymeric immunoglobulin receptor-like n=1 Tax=Paramisgurnus dabryanus TaxID=90735 RepID=UPI0031F4021B